MKTIKTEYTPDKEIYNDMIEVLVDEYKNICICCINNGDCNFDKIKFDCGSRMKDIIERATGKKIEELL